MQQKVSILFSILTISFLSIGQNNPTNGFYSINYNTDHLVFIDTLSNITDIGNVGRNINSKSVGLTFNSNNELLLSFNDSLFKIDMSSGQATPLFKTVNSINGQGITGSLCYNGNQLYLLKEETGFLQGRLFTVNQSNGLSTPVSSNTTGDASILATTILNGTFFSASELNDKLLKLNPQTGVVDYSYPNPLGMTFTNAMTNVNNSLWGIDIINETTSTNTRFCKIDTISGTSIEQFVLNETYTGLAWGFSHLCYNIITVTDTLIINTGLIGVNPISYKNTIKIFPNPTNDHITIDYGNYAVLNGYQLIIENSLGQQMFQTPINQQSSYISLASWTGNGLYFVHIIDSLGNTIDIRKIVLQ